MSLPLMLIGLIGLWLLGVACQELLLPPSDAKGRARSGFLNAERMGLGLVLGIAASSGLSLLYSLSGGRLGREWSLALIAVGWICGGLVLVRRWVRRPAAQSPADDGDAAGLAFGRFCRSLVAILFLSSLVQTLLTPQRFWDERATFAIKAAVLDEDGAVSSSDLRHPDFVQFHPRYPLLIPLAEQHIYALLGEVDDRWSKVLFPLLYLGLVMTFAGVLERHTSSARSWLFALLLATVPALLPYEYGFLSAQADAPLACFHGVSLLYLWDALRCPATGGQMWRSLVIAGAAAAAAAFTKDEGLALMLVDSLALVIGLSIGWWRRAAVAGRADAGRDRSPEPGVRTLAAMVVVFIGVAVVCLSPWLWHRGSLPMTTEMNYVGRATVQRIRDQWGTLSWSIPHIVRRMLGDFPHMDGVRIRPDWWGLQWWLMLVSLVSFHGRALRREQLVLILDVLGAVAALLIAGMLSPTELTEHLGGSSHRFLMQLAPVAMLFSAGQWLERGR